MSRRNHPLVNAALLCLALCQPITAAMAQGYPNKTIKFVVPFPAGSATDNTGRIVAQALSEQLNTPIVIENKPGANGILGAEAVKTAANDGYTLLVTTNTTQAANVSLYKTLSYDPVKDFTPVGKIGVTGFMLITSSSLAPNNLGEFISYAKANPGKLSYGAGSSGSHVSGAMFATMTGLDVLTVPYKGIPPGIVDVLSGNLTYIFADIGNGMAQVRGGKVKAHGITLPKRSDLAPGIPAIAESVPGYGLGAWFALMLPANAPKDVVTKLNSALQIVLTKPAVKQKLLTAGIDIDFANPEDLAKLIQSEIELWAKQIKAAGIKPE
jgi:tripartite-type tricarboxylate transporter receptor subunit TctC